MRGAVVDDDLARTIEFDWQDRQDNKYEPQQQERHLETLKGEVRLPDHVCWVSGANHEEYEELLKTSIWSGGADLPFPVDCKADACVATSRCQYSVELFFAATVEIKKKVVQQSLRQARTQFVCASLRSQLPVISTVTDMQDVGVAYYIDGRKNEEGWTVITERVFGSAKAMMHFLGSAMRSLPPRTSSTNEFNLPSSLPEPHCRRLPVPPPSQATLLERQKFVQQFLAQAAYGNDVANLAYVDE